MIKWLLTLFEWISNIWSNIPKKEKEQIIRLIVETFSFVFRAYYKSQKEGEKESDNA